MFRSILGKSVASRTPATTKSFSCTPRPLKSLFRSKLMNEPIYLSWKPFSEKFLPSFSSCVQHRFLSKETQEPVEPPSHSPLTDESMIPFFHNIDYDAITNKDPELTKKLKILVTEAYILYEEGKEIPSKLTNNQVKELLALESRTARYQLLRHLFLIERRKEADQAKKLAKREEYEKSLAERAAQGTESSDDKLVYTLASNCLFQRIYDTSIDRYNNFTLFLAAMLGPKVIIDCGYSSHMVNRESKMCARQLMMAFGDNRKHNFPVHLVFCNYNKEDLTSKMLLKSMPTMYDPHFPFEFHSESYLNLYPKEKLIYLTPHCKDVLHTVKGDDTFIIGAMVDQVTHEKASLAKAKQEGLRMAKFPIDQYLDWGKGVKNLTINQCIMILTDMYWKNDWKYAFDRWVPKRKLMSNDHVAYAAKLLKRLTSNDDVLSFRPKFRQTNNYNERFNHSDYSNSIRKRPGFNKMELFDESEAERNENQTFGSRLPPRRSR